MVAIMGCVRKEGLLRGIIHKRRPLGKTVEGALVLGAHLATRASFLDDLANPRKKGQAQFFLVSILHARIEGIETLLPQTTHTFVTIAWGRTAAVEPNAVELVMGDKVLDEVEFFLNECHLAGAELPKVRSKFFVLGRTCK
jgi:hypothetical protein